MSFEKLFLFEVDEVGTGFLIEIPDIIAGSVQYFADLSVDHVFLPHGPDTSSWTTGIVKAVSHRHAFEIVLEVLRDWELHDTTEESANILYWLAQTRHDEEDWGRFASLWAGHYAHLVNT